MKKGGKKSKKKWGKCDGVWYEEYGCKWCDTGDRVQWKCRIKLADHKIVGRENKKKS